MKRFAVFDYPEFYPGGGWNDFEGWYDSLEEALSAHPSASQVVDLHTGQVVHGDQDY